MGFCAGDSLEPMTEFSIKTFDQLTLYELHGIYLTRGLVFTVGQKITEQEIDEVDLHCIHLFHKADNGRILGYIRMFDLGGAVLDDCHQPMPGAWTIGRVAVLPETRGTGLGRRIMDAGINWIKTNTDAERIEITAQSYLKDTLYKDFTAYGEEFLEAGIPHYHMVLDLH